MKRTCYRCGCPIELPAIYCGRCLKSIKARNQAIKRERDSSGRFFRDVDYDELMSFAQMGTPWVEVKKSSKKPCREQMDLWRNHENRIKSIESKLKNLKQNYKDIDKIESRLKRLEKALEDTIIWDK